MGGGVGIFDKQLEIPELVLKGNSASRGLKNIIRAVKPSSITPTITGRQLTSSDGLRLFPDTVVSSPAEDLPHLRPFAAGYGALQKQRLPLQMFIAPRPLSSFSHARTCTQLCSSFSMVVVLSVIWRHNPRCIPWLHHLPA